MLQYNRARAAKAHIVNVLWAERCREDGKRADESAFAVGGSVPPGEATNASRIQLPSLITASAVTPGGAQSHARRSMEPHVLVAADVNNRRHSLSALKQQRTPLGGLSTSANGTPVTALTARSTSAGGTPSSAAPFKTPLPKAKKRKRSDGKEDKDKDEKENITCNSLHDEENQVSNTLHDKENAVPDNVGAADYTTSTAINKPRRAAAMRVAKAVAEMYAASANPEDVASDSASNSSSADTNVALATSVEDKFAADEDDDTLDERRTRALFVGYRPPLASEETPMPRKIQRLPHLVFTGFQEEYGGKWGGVGGRMIPFIRNSEYETLLSAVNHLGSFQTVDSVTARTSHVVCKSKKWVGERAFTSMCN